MIISLQVDLGKDTTYIFEQAKLRGLGPEAMLRRLLSVIAREHLVFSVLDDDGKPSADHSDAPIVVPRRVRSKQMSIREREVHIIALLSKSDRTWLGDIEPNESKRMQWYPALSALVERGVIMKHDKDRKADRQYYSLQSQVSSPELSSQMVLSSPEIVDSGSSVLSPPRSEPEFVHVEPTVMPPPSPVFIPQFLTVHKAAVAELTPPEDERGVTMHGAA